MFWVIIFVAFVALALGYLNTVNLYKDSVRNLKKIKGYFDKIEKGMSLSEVESLLGSKGRKYQLKDQSMCKWFFDETVLTMEYSKNRNSPKVFSISKYFKNYDKYLLVRGQSFAEVYFENGIVCDKVAVGLI